MARSRSNRGGTGAADMKVGTEQNFEVPATGGINPDDFKDQFEVQKAEGFRDKAEMLAFMEEKLLIEVHTTTDKSKEPIPCVSVNGVNQYIVRGRQQLIKRKFVQELARAKEEAITTPFAKDANGFDTYNIAKRHALKYPFSVLEDKNPRGRDWLSQILAEAA